MTITHMLIPHHGRSVHAVLYLPESAAPVPAVLMSHGYNGCKTDFDHGARRLAENGVAALCYTFCGGSTRDESGFPSTSMTLLTEQEDALALLDYLRSHPAINAEKVFLFGGSMGGIVSVLASQARPEDVAGLGLLFPALCIPENWTERYATDEEIPQSIEFWGLTLGKGFVTSLRGMDVFAKMPEYSKPVIIFQGAKDPIATLGHSERAASLYPDAELVVYPEEAHGFRPEADADVFRRLLAFVQKNA